MDNHLGLYLFTDRPDSSEDQAYEVEYAVIADAHIVGEFNRGSLLFSVWDPGVEGPGQEHWLCLQVRYMEPIDAGVGESLPRPDKMSNNERKRQRAAYHGGGVPEEVVALASLFLRRR